MTPSRFRWGSLLVLIGTVLLLRNFDVITNSFWTDFLIYFPVLLIAIGIEKIFTGTKLQYVSYFTTIVLFAGGLYLSLAGGKETAGDFFSDTSWEWNDEPNVKELHAILNVGHGSVTIRDATDELVNAQFKEFTAKPEVVKTVSGSVGNITFTSKGASQFLGGLVKVDAGKESDWFVSFSETVPLTLECNGKESDIHLNLATTPTKKVDVKADNATLYLKLGDLQPLVNVDISGADSEVRLRLPVTAGLKISGVADANYLKEVGLKQHGDGFVSDGYDTLKTKIDVNLDDKQSSLSIDFY